MKIWKQLIAWLKALFQGPVPAPIYASLEAKLAAVEDQLDPTSDPAQPPTVASNAEAMDVYAEMGKADAASPGIDKSTNIKVAQPAAGSVLSWSRTPVVVLGQGFQRMRAAYQSGALGHVAEKIISHRKVAWSMWPKAALLWILVAAAATFEVVYGQHAAALLSRAYPDEALAAAVAVMLASNLGAYFAGSALYQKFPGIVAHTGARAAGIILTLTSGVAVALGLVLGGFDILPVSGVSGGGAATAQSTASQGRLLVTITYTALLVLVAVSIIVGHLLFSHSVQMRWMNKQKEAERDARLASLKGDTLRQVALKLTDAYIAAIDSAHFQGKRRVAAYNAAFRRSAAPAVNEMFDDVHYDNSAPDWKGDAEQFITELKKPEPANLQRVV